MSKYLVVIIFCVLCACQSEYYQSAYSTPHGTRAQEKYIKNAKRHDPSGRFFRKQNTFGAVDLRKGR